MARPIDVGNGVTVAREVLDPAVDDTIVQAMVADDDYLFALRVHRIGARLTHVVVRREVTYSMLAYRQVPGEREGAPILMAKHMLLVADSETRTEIPDDLCYPERVESDPDGGEVPGG